MQPNFAGVRLLLESMNGLVSTIIELAKLLARRRVVRLWIVRRRSATNTRRLITIWCFLIVTPLLAQTNSSADTNSAVWVIPQMVRNINEIKQQQYVAFDPCYQDEKASFITRLRAIAKRMFADEKSGKDVGCAKQVYAEILWLVSSTADFKRMNQRLDDLERDLASSVTNEPVCNTSDELDCYAAWWERLDWSYGHLKKGEPIPPEILDRINSPKKLAAYLTPLSVSDISRTGRDNWLQFNMSLADLIRWIVRDRPSDFNSQMKRTLMNLVLRFQDPETGYWGQRYVINGRKEFIPDLSTTFHIVTYLQGKVPHLDRIVATTLATKDLDSPVGWLWKGQNYNHNNYDVVWLFKWGWPYANARQKKAMAAGIEDMLHRCLAGLQSDGSFRLMEANVSVEDATYFGAGLLYQSGYFCKSKRFWTDQDFPHAQEVRQKIIGFIRRQLTESTGSDSGYREILEWLKAPSTSKPMPTLP